MDLDLPLPCGLPCFNGARLYRRTAAFQTAPDTFGASGDGADGRLGFFYRLPDLLAIIGGVLPGILFGGPGVFFALYTALYASGLDAFFDGGKGSTNPGGFLG